MDNTIENEASHIGHETIGVGHDPFALGESPRGRIYGRSGNVYAVRFKTRQASQRAEIESVAASGIQDDVIRRCGHHFPDALEQGLGYPALV